MTIQTLPDSGTCFANATASIPIKLDPDAGNTADVRTIGVMTTVVTAAGVSDDVVYALTKELFENLDAFKTKHPAFSALTAKGMLRGLFAPVHDGAMRYYKEAGLNPVVGGAAAAP